MSDLKNNSTKKGNNLLERLNSLKHPPLVFDGATGTSLQELNLNPEDFGGSELEGCNEILVLTSPSNVEKVHRDFLNVGCDVIETNTFGANSIVLAEYGLESKTSQINIEAASLAKRLAQEYTTLNKPRYVAGSIGPTTKLPTLGHITFDELRDSYQEQSEALINGGVDLFIIETCQDVLQIKAALIAIEESFNKLNKRIPIMVSVTMETTGTMLLGTDITSVVTILEPFNIDILGLNCATGPQQMKDHIKYLSINSPFILSCIPNAGLPENIGGKAHYKLTPIELKMQLMHFIKDLNVRVIGGCCGTTPEHIKQLVDLTSEIISNDDYDFINNRKELCKYEKSASSIYNSTPYIQDKSFLIVGERLNASGSKKVRELLNEEDWDGLVNIARGQLKENSHILDVNVDYVGRDGVLDMKEVVSRIVSNVNLPLMLDSTEFEKMESGLKVAGGKSILNSTNYEDGNERFHKVVSLAKKYGAGVVVGTIDESGMARTATDKVKIVERAYKDITDQGISEQEIFFDTLALPISTGIEEDRKNASETIKSIKQTKQKYPNVHLILGISNISFGLSPSSRIVLNSVFLDICCRAGLDAAIISPSKIIPLSKIPKDQIKVCNDLIFDKREFEGGICTYDPLTQLTKLFEGVSTKATRGDSESLKSLPLEERLQKHIIDGEKIGLEDTLKDALSTYKPLEIINDHLLQGMKTVGELFGSGQMQLPFVLQSAETMKSAVSYLEPLMDRVEGQSTYKAKVLIATVKGDVHDIGKNLVDIILSNNGYEVINLGIKQDISNIIEAQNKYHADCIAMSGLLVKSTAFMKENLLAFNDSSITVPVILGGAALTPKFVKEDCNSVYNGQVIYGKDAFTDLRFMDEYVKAKNNKEWTDKEGFSYDNKNKSDKGSKVRVKSTNNIQNSNITEKNVNNKTETISHNRSSYIEIEQPLNPPFIGTKVEHHSIDNLDKIIKYLDENALFSGQWQMKRIRGQSSEDYNSFIEAKARPVLNKWLERIKSEKLLEPSSIYGYFPVSRSGNNIIIYDEKTKKKVGQFDFPRQRGNKRLCISDYFSDSLNNQPSDYLPMQAVTMGARASDFAGKLFEKDLYSDYLYFHGIAVQLAEALAEYIHHKIRIECGYEQEESADIKAILKQNYRGSRFSFGYPACPKVSDSSLQLKLLNAKRISLTMDESDQLHPEQSTTAIVCLHSQAKYFSA